MRKAKGIYFQKGTYFRKQTGRYVYMVTEHATADRGGKGVSFKGSSTSLQHNLTYVVCSAEEFTNQISNFHKFGIDPDGRNEYPHGVVAEQRKTKTTLSSLIDAVESIPNMLRLARTCQRVKKVLDEEGLLG